MKKIVTIIAIALICVLGLSGCASASTVDKVSIEGTQSLDYAVIGNGGSAVQYGNYLYFINGTRGYEDTDGTNNVTGKVVKGALYRAELTGTSVANPGAEAAPAGKTGNTSVFRIERDAESGIKLVSEKGTSYDNKEINVVDVQLISSKTIGTDGYADGGLYIFNRHIYFASPCATKDKEGNVMYLHNEFYRTDLVTGETQLLLTSETENNDMPYGFYCYNDSIYLVYVESGDTDYIVSARINEQSGSIDEKKRIADKVTTVLMPTKSTYYYGIPTDTVYDFIYYGSNGSDVDSYRTDSMMSFVRPDGSENTVFNSGSDAQLLDVEGGMLLYKITDDAMPAVKATDMYNYFMSGSESFAAAHEGEDYTGSFAGDKTVYAGSAVSDATATDCFVPGIGVNSNAVYLLLTAANATTSSNNDLTLYAPDGSITVVATGASAKYVNHTSDKLFYTITNSSNLELYSVGFDGKDAQLICSAATEATFMSDVEADYLIFFGQVDDQYSGYTLFYDLAGLEGRNDAFFVGEKTADETRSNVGSIEIDTDDAKLRYAVGESLDVTGLTITAYTYVDKDGEKAVIEEGIPVTSDMVSGFDTSAVSDAVTLTVTYEGVTATYDISVYEQSGAASCGTVGTPSGWIFGVIALAGAAAVLLLFRKKKTA